MKSTISLHDFREGFKRLGRENFSYEGLAILFDYFEQLEEDIGEEFEYDPISICCEFAEYASIAEAANEYGITPSELIERTTVIEFEGGVIVENF